jgi:large subunit ribosomal protein L32
MPVPKRKTARSRRGRRRAHDAIKLPNLVPCPTCRQPKPSHQVCPNCGSYKGQEVLDTGEKAKD